MLLFFYVCVQPIAVLLCPGWEKIQAVYDLLEEMRVIQSLHPVTVLLGIGKDEPKAVRIPKNCEPSTISICSANNYKWIYLFYTK